MITTTTISDGRAVTLVDLDNISPEQGLHLANAMADLLIRSGMIDPNAALSGPHLIQFTRELADSLAGNSGNQEKG